MAASPSGFGRWLLVLAAGLVVVCTLGYRVLSKNSALAHSNSASYPEPTAAAASTGTGSGESASVSATLPAALEPSPVAPSAEPALAAAGAETAAAASAPEPSAALKPTPTPSAAASGTDIRRVTVKSKPAKVRFFHFGKQVGVTPFVLEFKPGERHAYEAGLPGYGTRKVVIDGSKPEITIGLRREKP